MIENIIHTRIAPAAFKAFLSSSKSPFPFGVVKDYVTLCADFQRTHELRLAHNRDAAEAEIRAIRQRAEDDPSTENIAALASCSPDEIRRRHEAANEALAAVEAKLLQRMKPVVAALRDVVLPIVEKEMSKVEAENRETFAKYGARYEPAADLLLRSLARWRDVVARHLSGDPVALRPDQVEEWLGPVRAR